MNDGASLLWQVVLVRSEEAKRRVAAAAAELAAGLVLTVEEAKGLEFDDVCIWNFFTDSPADKEWYTLYELYDGAAPALGLGMSHEACDSKDSSVRATASRLAVDGAACVAPSEAAAAR